ncbi:MAG: D-ribose pyranase [Thermomicrobiales bacterium]|nr:D-ribose pyranase [Thermomicrobiales bacterium]MCO5220130.1 D-ribose pyranase [Thermomicrobiales bacterium]
MKLGGVLNHRLSMVIAEMGHTDGLTVADAGLPVPLDVERIDLAVSPGVPSFAQVLEAIASELKVEEIVLAREAFDLNPELLRTIERYYPGVPTTAVPHVEFKELTGSTRAVIRSGECAPYANCILRSGVIF